MTEGPKSSDGEGWPETSRHPPHCWDHGEGKQELLFSSTGDPPTQPLCWENNQVTEPFLSLSVPFSSSTRGRDGGRQCSCLTAASARGHGQDDVSQNQSKAESPRARGTHSPQTDPGTAGVPPFGYFLLLTLAEPGESPPNTRCPPAATPAASPAATSSHGRQEQRVLLGTHGCVPRYRVTTATQSQRARGDTGVPGCAGNGRDPPAQLSCAKRAPAQTDRSEPPGAPAAPNNPHKALISSAQLPWSPSHSASLSTSLAVCFLSSTGGSHLTTEGNSVHEHDFIHRHFDLNPPYAEDPARSLRSDAATWFPNSISFSETP